jgi:hypothetical protein
MGIENLDITAQTFGLLSFLLGITTFYQKDDKKLKLLMLALNINHCIHFLLLGSIVSALSAVLSALRTVTAIYISSKWVAAIFIFISIVCGIALADHISQLWSIAGTVVGTYSIFLLKGIKLRIGFLIGASCWLINNILVGSIGGTLLEMSAITVNLTTVYRLYRDQKQLINPAI